MNHAFLKRLLSQMAVLTAARVIGAVCIFFTTLLITRSFGSETLAQYSIYLALASLLSVLLPFGFPAIAAMMVAEYKAREQTALLLGFVKYGQRIILVSSAIVFLAALLLLPFAPNSADYNLTVLVGFAVPSALAMAFLYFNGGVLIGLEHQFSGHLPDILIRPVLLFLTIAVTVLLWQDIASWQLLMIASCVISVAAIVQWRALQAFAPTNHSQPINAVTDPTPLADEKRKWWKMTPSWTLITLLWDYFLEIHILMASLLFASFEVALLHICFRIRQLAGFGMRALYSLLLPKIFSGNALDKHEDTKALITLASRLTLIYAVAAWLGAAILGTWLLGVFGPEYQQGQTILLIVMGTLPVRALFGPAPAVLGMKRNEGLVAQILLVSLAISLVLTLVGFQFGGLEMLAWGYLAATTFTAISMWVAAKKKTGINCAVWA